MPDGKKTLDSMIMDEHADVGPVGPRGDHENMIAVSDDVEQHGALFFICLDCGLTSETRQRFAFKHRCDRENNDMNVTVPEKYGGDDS